MLALPLPLPLLLAAPAAAAPAPTYTGEFQALQVGAGPAFASAGPGVTFDVSARASTVLHLADVELGYRYADIGDGPRTHGLQAGLHVHPLFLFLLGNDTLAATLASFYVRVGAGGFVGRDAAGDDAADLSWELAGGFDLPLAPLPERPMWWLGLQVGRAWAFGPDPFEGEGLTFVSLRVALRRDGPL